MKKRFALCLIILLISINTFSYNSIQAVNLQNDGSNDTLDSKEGSYCDAVKAFLARHIGKAINEFYGQYLTHIPMEDPWHVQFISFEQEGYEFLIKVNVQPYVGAHNSVGIDYITFRVNPSGDVTIERFKHVKSFPIPHHLQDIIKKWPPSETGADNYLEE